jgi:hypothetical protein
MDGYYRLVDPLEREVERIVYAYLEEHLGPVIARLNLVADVLEAQVRNEDERPRQTVVRE